MEAQKRLELSTRVTPEIVVETVSFEGGYVSYYRVHGKRVGTLEYYDDELAAREGHLRWVRQDWGRKTLPEIERLLGDGRIT